MIRKKSHCEQQQQQQRIVREMHEANAIEVLGTYQEKCACECAKIVKFKSKYDGGEAGKKSYFIFNLSNIQIKCAKFNLAQWEKST